MELLRSLLAAFIGTGLMSRSSFTEMYWEGRPASVVPGQAANQILKILGVPEIAGRGLQILSNYTHWILGVSWGVVFYLLVGVADLNLGVPVSSSSSSSGIRNRSICRSSVSASPGLGTWLIDVTHPSLT